MTSDKVDKRRLMALLRIGLKVEFRGASNPFGGMFKKKSGFPPLAGVLIFYFLIGIVLTAIVIKSSDLFTAMFLLCSSVMVFIAMTVLLEFSQTILTPDDYSIIGPQPVSSKTFFLAKLLNLLILVAALTLALGLAPSIAASLVWSMWLMAPVLLLTLLATAWATATFIVIFYTLMLRISSRERMNSLLGYLQLGLIFGFYGMMLVIPDNVDMISESLANARGWYLYLAPPAWFASWPAIIFDSLTSLRAYAAAMGVLALVVGYFLVLSRLSIGYAKSLNETVLRVRATVARKEGTLGRIWRRITNPEERVVSRLIRVQFRYDNRYKITVLSIVPLAALYLYLGSRDGKSLVDPFVLAGASGTPNVLFYFAIGILPLMIIAGTCYSAAYQAAWVFFTSPANRVRLVLATKRFAIVYFCLPFIIAIFLLQGYYFGDLLHSALHSLTIFLLCTIAITIMVMVLGRVPFSLPLRKGATTSLYIVSWIVPLLLILPPLIIIARVGYGGLQGYGFVIAILLLVDVLLTLLQNRIVRRRVKDYEFVAQ